VDKRNSKRQMLERVQYLEAQCEALYSAGLDGIAHVGSANYAEREIEAKGWVEKAYWNFELEKPSEEGLRK